VEINVKPIVEQFDYILSKSYLRFYRERNSLIVFLFHTLLRDKTEIRKNLIYPGTHEEITIKHFRRFIEFFLDHNYLFITPEDILNGLNKEKKYALITFDDGYYNNINALPILNEYKVPAVFFVSTNHIKYNKCFWADVLYREGVRQGKLIKEISREVHHFKKEKTKKVEKYFLKNFGKKAFQPKSDIDRPFTPSELKDFSREKYVFLGNHTREHAILTNYSTEEIRKQILGAQEDIFEITAKRPKIISYPNGSYSNRTIRISREIGMKLGISVIQKKNYLQINLMSNESMRLGRFVLHGDRDLRKQCEVIRSDISLKTLYNRLKSSINSR